MIHLEGFQWKDWDGLWADFIVPMHDFTQEVPVLVVVPGISMAFNPEIGPLPSQTYPQADGWSMTELANSLLQIKAKCLSAGMVSFLIFTGKILDILL